MDDINYLDIIANVPFDYDGIAEYFERKMKMAENKLFYKPETFIRELTKEIDNKKEEIIKDAANQRTALEHEINTAYDCGNENVFNLGIDVLMNEAYDDYHKRQTERHITGYELQLEEVNRNEINFLSVLSYLQRKVNDLKSSKLPPLTRKLSETKQSFLYKELKDERFIGVDEDYQNFRFAFGGTSLMGGGFKKIKWCVGNKQCLRDLLSEIKKNTDADMLRTVKHYFLDRNGQEMKLPQNSRSHNDSADESTINEILKKFKEL